MTVGDAVGLTVGFPSFVVALPWLCCLAIGEDEVGPAVGLPRITVGEFNVTLALPKLS